MLKRLNILNFDKQHVARLSIFNLERSAEVMNLGKVNISDIVGTVIVADLSASPVNTFDLYCLTILDFATERYLARVSWVLLMMLLQRTIWVPAVLFFD